MYRHPYRHSIKTSCRRHWHFCSFGKNHCQRPRPECLRQGNSFFANLACYIKDGLVPRAEGKRYGPIHLGYLTAVVALKQVLSVRDIGALMGAGRALEKSTPEQYAYFRDALDRALSDTAQSIDPEAGESDLAKMALDFAVRSYANQLACQRILSILQPQDGKKK